MYGKRKGGYRKGKGYHKKSGSYKYGVRGRGRSKRIKKYGVSRGGIRM